MKRLLSVALVTLMILSLIPMSVLAAVGSDLSVLNSVGYTIISDDESTLAPGVTMNEVVMYDSNGDRVEMYVTTSDPSVETVKYYANYKDNQCAQWGMQTLSEQVAAIEANYEEPFKVVAGLNASYYNTTNGAPTGAFVMEGVDASASGDGYAFFAVLKDGTVMIGDKGEYSSYKGQIKEAIGGYIHIVKDGAIVSGLDKVTKYPRQTIGITADGRVITMTADGSQAPRTIGLTVYEQAQVMLELGCVDALHLDGGNSATFGAIREGSDKFETVNTPSGQAERAVSNTLMIVSTAIPDGAFDHAVITSDYDYIVPGTKFTFDYFGVDATNSPAKDIPDGITWALSDNSFGTISDGTFVSNGKLGDVDIQLVLDGKTVGSKTISVVNPESITFGAEEKTVPYGKTSALTVTAIYKNNEVYCVASDFNWVIANTAAGTLDGFDFTATTNESIAGTTVTATYKHATLAAASVALKFGKGSEVLFDFEGEGDLNNWRGTDTINEWIDDKNAQYTDAKYTVIKPTTYGNQIESQGSSVFLASKENGGQVKSGDYALGVTLDRLQAGGVGSWIYNYMYYTGDTQVWRDVANGNSAVRVGMWVYMPQNATNTAFRICRTFTKDSTGKLYTNYDYMTSAYDGKKVSYNTDYAIPESGWMYVYFDLTAYDFQSSTQYNPNENYAMNNGKKIDGDYYPAFIQFINGDKNDTMESTTIYIDDITLDYSDVIDDRDAPTITDAKVSANIDNYVALNGQTVTNNYLSFMATVAEVTNKSNYTGLDYSTAKIYIDGIDMSKNSSFVATGSVLGLSDVYLVDGTHEITFEIADNQGNVTRHSKTLTVNGTAGNAKVYITGHNNGNHTPKAGSVYYIDIKASDASKVKNVVTALTLNTANTFECDHIIAADGVEVTYKHDKLNSKLSLDITTDGTLSGDTALVSIPVRVWAWDEVKTGVTSDKQFSSGSIPVIDIECETVNGKITYFDSTYDSYVAGFYSAIDVATELDNSTAWHKHTAVAVDDAAATCTTTGYTGRTYCEGCASVIDWGTTVDATGHTYEIIDGVLKCRDCDVLFTGVHTDGKEYADGIVLAGWIGESYYVDGVKLTGINKIGDLYYNFGDDGICKGKNAYTGLFFDTADGVYRYALAGELDSGWILIENDWYYFRYTTLAAQPGYYTVGGIKYHFEENGKLTSGVWEETENGWRYHYGPGWYGKGWAEINGDTYYFQSNGCRVEGIMYLRPFFANNPVWYEFTDEGVLVGQLTHTGFYEFEGNTYYLTEGVGALGLQLIDGDYYYFHTTTGIMAADEYTHVYETNGLLSEGDYYFDASGKMAEAKNGIIAENGGLYYYVNGKLQKGAGMIKIDEDYYFVRSNGSLATGNYNTYNNHGLKPDGVYYFDPETGKLTEVELKNGIISENGGLYYYVDGILQKGAGMIKLDGDYYFVRSNGKLATGSYNTYNNNGLLADGVYDFDTETGKLILNRNGIVFENGELYYYIDNVLQLGAGMIKIDGDYYFVRSNGKLAVGMYNTYKNNGYMPNGEYFFDYNTGKLGTPKDGIVAEDDGLYYYVNGVLQKGAGMIEIDGDLYFVRSNGKLATGSYNTYNNNGLKENGVYFFDTETGKLMY